MTKRMVIVCYSYKYLDHVTIPDFIAVGEQTYRASKLGTPLCIKMAAEMNDELKQLQDELIELQYDQELDLDLVQEGSVEAYIPIYRYIFTQYNTDLNDAIGSLKIHVRGLEGVPFMNEVYKILRGLLDYEPEVTPYMFFSNDFVDEKFDMALEVLRAVKRRHPCPKHPTQDSQSFKPGKRKSRISMITRAAEKSPENQAGGSTWAPARMDTTKSQEAPTLPIKDPSLESAVPEEEPRNLESVKATSERPVAQALPSNGSEPLPELSKEVGLADYKYEDEATQGRKEVPIAAENAQALDRGPDLDILLMGKTGAGKSATGNTILGHKAFKPGSGTVSVTEKSKKDVAELENGRRIVVVDTPGLADTSCSEEDGKKLFENAVKEAFIMSPYGYHAFLLTFRFGNRFTKEDSGVVDHLKKVFGKKFLQKYCIIVITGGDNFYSDEDMEGKDFCDWCRKQSGEFEKIYKEANGRVILFNNRASKKDNDLQRQQLIKMIDDLASGGKRYTNERFDEAKTAQEKILKDKEIAILSDDIKNETSIIITKLEKVHAGKDYANAGEKLTECTKLKERINKQLKRIGDSEHNEMLDKVRLIVLQAQDKLETEVSNLHRINNQKAEIACAEKRLKQALESDRDKKAQEVKKLQQQLENDRKLQAQENAKRAKVIEEAVKELDKMRSDYQQIRDENNSSLSSKIVSYLSSTWPFSKIKSFLFSEYLQL